MIKPNIVLEGEFLAYEDLLSERFPIRRVFDRGETIYGFTDDRSKYCFYVVRGLVQCSYLSESGIEMTSTMRGEGTIFPLYYTHKSTTIERTLEFSAARKTELIVIPKAKLAQLMQEEYGLALAMMDAWGEYATYILYTAETRFESVRHRVCGFLALHRAGDGTIRMTHDAIARATGTTRENVTRVLSDLQRAGIVQLSRGKVVILDGDRLAAESSYVSTIEE